MIYSIETIREVISAEKKTLVPATITTLLTDSRNVTDTSGALFFAFETKHNDGHKYIRELIDKGVCNFVVQKKLNDWDEFPSCNFLLVGDTLQALQKLAIFHRNHFQIPIVGITGSNGKTIVKEWLYQLLNEEFNIVRSPRSFNSQIGVPLSVCQLEEETQLGIFEAGISQVNEMGRLQPMVNPTVGLLTNIGDAHQENFMSLQEKAIQKLLLFKDSDVLIYDGDDYFVENAVEEACLAQRAFAWSRKDSQAPLYLSKIEKDGAFTQIDFTFLGIENRIRIPFVDEASVENAIHCLAVVLYLRPSITDLQKKFLHLEPVDMRLDVVKGINNCILINDTYNSDIHSLEIALDFMATRLSGSKLKTTLILSDILQSGILPKVLYNKVETLVRQKKVDRIIGIGRDLMANADRFSIEKEFFLTTNEFLEANHFERFKDEVILIKGSRKFEFEKITAQLEGKVHETILEVDLDAIVHNFNYFRSRLKPETKMIAMIKAFGYGIGAYELAKTLQNQRCDYLAVALADEGAELRQAGISIPILIMNPEMSSFNTIFQYQLEPEIYNFRLMEAFIKESERRGITHYPVHLKFDTGMHRLGFEPEEVDKIVGRLKTQKGIKVRSLFSHLAGADSEVLDEYTRHQFEVFEKIACEITSALPYPVMKHILNSAGIERFPECQYDMVRLGISLYGISSVPGQGLRTVATLKSTLLQIRSLPAGETVGYGRKGLLQRDSRIACVPIGYADGLDRHLSNGVGAFWVNGTLCPIVGNICMDVTMIDVTDAEAKEGDSVVVFGKELPVEGIAEKLGTIPYEIFTSISPRVKRVYFRE